MPAGDPTVTADRVRLAGKLGVHALSDTVFRDHWDHLQGRLDLLDARLRQLVDRARRERPAAESAATSGWGHGMFVGEEEIDELLGGRGGHPPLEEIQAEIRAREAASFEAGVDLPLQRLARVFQLSPWEEEMMVVCLASELDPRYERVFGYLHDDMTRREPSVELALALLGGDLSMRAAGRAALHDSATLIRAGLLVWREDTAESNPPRLSRAVRLAPRIVDGLLGKAGLAPLPWLRALPTVRAEASGLAPRLLAMARESTLGGSAKGKLLVSLHGGSHAAAVDVAAQVCGQLEVPLLLLDLTMLSAAGVPYEKAVREAAREALLQPAALLVECGEGLGQNQPESDLRMNQLLEALEDFTWLVFVHAKHPVGARDGSQQSWLTAELPPPDLPARATAWLAALTASGIACSQGEADSLAARYRLGIAQIGTVMSSAQLQARLRGAAAKPALEDVEAACRDLGASALSGLATRVSPRFGWDDIVLPADALRQLEEIVAAVRSRRKVLADWGFGAR
jgi:hypothetical protein